MAARDQTRRRQARKSIELLFGPSLRDRGGLLPSERDLAGRLGVSRVTVRGALDELAQEGRVVREQGRGTRVVGTPPKPAGTMAVLFNSPAQVGLAHDASAELLGLLEGVAIGAASAGDGLLMVPCSGYGSHVLHTSEQAGPGSVLDSLAERADGAILLEWSESGALAPHLEQRGFPYVVCNLEDEADVVATRVDHVDVGRQAATALAEAGYTRPLVFAGSSTRHVFGQIRQGFGKQWTGRATRWRECAGRPEAMRAAILAEMDGGLKFDSIFAYGDQRVCAVLDALEAHGLEAPENVGLLGYGRATSEMRAAQVTLLEQPTLELGRAAAAALRRQMLGAQAAPRQTILPVSLVAGRTLAAGNPATLGDDRSDHKRRRHRQPGAAR